MFFTIREDRPFFITTLATVASTTEVTISPTSEFPSFGHGEFRGHFLYIKPITFIQDIELAPRGEMRRILKSYPTGVLILENPFSKLPIVGDKVEILRTSSSNICGLNTNLMSPTIQTSSSVKCLVRLVSISIPLQNTHTYIGGTVLTYPYVNVLLENIGIAVSNTNSLFTNTPQQSATFRATLVRNNLQVNTDTKFVTFKCDIEQTMMLNFKTPFRLRISAPDGDTIEFTISENFSPFRPNPFVQISALFEIKKIN